MKQIKIVFIYIHVIIVAMLLAACVPGTNSLVTYNPPPARNAADTSVQEQKQVVPTTTIEYAVEELLADPQQPANSLQPIRQSSTGKRQALVIGNSAYASQALNNPVNDANDIAQKLKDVGFSVQLLRNANHQTMERGIIDFSSNLDTGTVSLFYYAGHGVQSDGRNYLMPIGSVKRINSSNDLRHESVALDWILGKLQTSGSPLNIVMLDACRDNPYKKGTRSGTRGLARESFDANGIIISYATGPGQVAEDGMGLRNSPYTSALLESIDQRMGKTIESVLKQVSSIVRNKTNNQQTPFYSSSIVGEFVF